MTSTPEQAIIKYMKWPDRKKTGYGVFMYYLNAETRRGPTTGPLGLIVFCGEYPTQEKAQSMAQEISIRTGCPAVCVVSNGKYKMLQLDDRENVIAYGGDDRKGLDDMRDAILREREMVRKIREETVHDDELATDPETLEHFIELIYKYSICGKHIETFESKIREIEESRKRHRDNLMDRISKHPEFLDQWMEKVAKNAKERCEENVAEVMYSEMERLMKGLELDKKKKEMSSGAGVESSVNVII